MKVITIDSEAYRLLAKKIDRIFDFVKQRVEQIAPAPDPSQIWIDNDEAAAMLEMSKRTLQRLRSGGGITYSIRGGRTWYTLDEVQRLLSGRIVASKYRQEADLIAVHQEYVSRRKTSGQSKNNKK